VSDKSGEPRSNEELIEAMNTLKKSLMTPSELSPIMVHYFTIIDAIVELLQRRNS